jgi:hypothetical protein
VVITTIGKKTVIAPNTNVVKRGVVIGFVVNLGCGLNGFSARRNLNRSLRLLVVNTIFVRTP